MTDLKAHGIIGDRVKNLFGLEIYKARLKNSSIDKGKSAGFRIIYYIPRKENYYFLSLYSKSEKSDMSNREIFQLLQSFLSTQDDG